MYQTLSKIIFAIMLISTIMGCAVGQQGTYSSYSSAVSRAPSSVESSNYEDSGPRTHPAAYFMDTFPVSRESNKRPANPNAEFFFKSCSRGGERWPHSRTSYDCSYP